MGFGPLMDAGLGLRCGTKGVAEGAAERGWRHGWGLSLRRGLDPYSRDRGPRAGGRRGRGGAVGGPLSGTAEGTVGLWAVAPGTGTLGGGGGDTWEGGGGGGACCHGHQLLPMGF